MTVDDQGSRDHHGNIVMPWVVTTSTGGPYDDRSFAAGFQAGAIISDINRFAAERRWPSISGTVYTAVIPQLDQIAMAYGVVCRSEPCPGHDDWSHVIFTFPEGEQP